MNKISEKKIKEIIEDLRKYKSLNNKKHKANYYYQARQNIIDSDHPIELIKEFLDIYSQCKRNISTNKEEIDTDDRAVTNVERNEEGQIQFYTFEIFRKDSPTFRGKLDRKEMETIYSLYSIYGQNLTQKIVSRNFPEYTFVEFKRILKAFNVYKASAPFPQHLLEELSEEELYQRTLREKENNITRRLEKDELKEANKLINKLAKENLELKKNTGDFHFIEDVEIKPWRIKEKYTTNKSLMLHLSDIHTGAKCNSGSLYENNWNEEELERRLERIVDLVGDNFGTLDTIVINMLGDYLDGMDNQTARRDHFMPQNMDNREQFNVFIKQMLSFIGQLSHYCSKLIVYAVPEGNHDGSAGYMAIKALEYAAKRKFPDIEFTVFEKFFGYYKFNNETFLIMHGKDSAYMKKPLPLNLNSDSSNLIRDWLDREGLHEEHIHIIKGDLHSNNLNACRKFDYRNVLSLFGESNYSQFNYQSNGYGISYDLFIGSVRTIGTFENF
jgi:hypothetical protein